MKADAKAAKDLFDKLFAAAATPDNPNLPGYFVPRSWFHKKCREAGIAVPENFIEACEWEKSIQLEAHVKKLCRAYRKAKASEVRPIFA